MSCVDSGGKTSEQELGKTCKTDDVEHNKGKPCIDFQPDERWQIKEDAKVLENVPNSKIKDINCSNGRRSQRLRNAKSNDSPVINGEADESSSDNDSININSKNNCSKSLNEVSNHSEDEKVAEKRKPSELVSEIVNMKDSENLVKKTKLNHVGSTDDNENSNGSESVENCDTISTEDSNDKLTAPILSPVTIQADKESENSSAILNSSVEIIEDEKEKSEDSSSSSKECEKKEKLQNTKIKKSNNEKEKKIKESNRDVDIEIINIDGKKSDEESDSEVQIINEDESEPRPSILDFPSTSFNQDVSLSAGFPYYNSLKEKISNFKAGEYKPVKFPHTGTLFLTENEVIIESPSLLVPLLIKEGDEFPKLEGEEKKVDGDSTTVPRSNMMKRNFFQSSVGQFLINLGVSRVQEWYHRDMKRTKMKQLKSKKATEEDLEKTIEFHEKRHSELKEINAAFNFRIRQCRYCNFKTESQSVMDNHYLTPHLSSRREFKCNFCSFLTRDPDEIKFHFEAMHGKKAVLEADIPFYECIFCSFQTNLKTKINGHMNRCRKHFIPSQNLAPPFDFEFPGVTTKPVTLADVIGHRRLLLSSASAKNRPSVPEDNSPNSAYARKKLASVLSKLSFPNTFDEAKNPNLMKQLMKNQPGLTPISASSSLQLPPGIVITRPRGSTIQQMPVGRYPPPRGIQTTIRGQIQRRGPPYNTNLTSAASHLASSGISITPVSRASILPRASSIGGIRNVTLTPISTASNRTVSPKPGPPQPVALFTNMAGSSGLLGQPQARLPVSMNLRQIRPAAPYQRLNTPPSQVVKGSSGNTFVVCEICDSYIKDLEELRTHMSWVHKVKIHPKMLVSRPPLNCQKCQWRFFTDQGLERHLLGAHGLVTTNMQEMANKNQDGGRCIICGAVFTYKLVSHMTQVHKVTLKPAHLSYKCTVCTATFTLYRLFESHVYNVHSGSAKRPVDDSSSEPPTKKVAEESGPKRCKDCNVVTENMHEHLIKRHMKNCSVKLCRIEKCKKCLYSSDEMLLIRMSDFGLDEDDSDDDSGSSDGSSEEDDET